MVFTRTWRNVAGTVAVFAAFFGLLQVAPEPSLKDAQLRCDYPGPPTAVFPDMATCAAAQEGKWRSCGCHRPDNVWSSWYVFGLVPVVTSVAGLLLLGGTL